MSEKAIEDVKDTVEEKAGRNGSDGLARKFLVPAAAGVGTLAATVAARKGPDLVRDRVMPLLEDKSAGELAKVGKDAASKLRGGVASAVAGKAAGGGGGREKTRRLPIQRWTDVAVPIAEAYEKWTQFEEFPKFMHRVLNVERKGDNRVEWQEKIWFSTREWEGEITDRRKNDRIAWKTTKGTSHSGVVSFHKVDTNLTRVLVTVDFHPAGMIEKMASGLRFAKRAVEADLARFKAYCEFDHSKGLEYAQPGELEEDQAGDDEGPRSKSNEGDTSKRDDDRAQSREERAERREERRSS
jgi:uncharacterized membrane protein